MADGPQQTCDFFFFNDTATTEIYTLSLHDALPISRERGAGHSVAARNLAPESEPYGALHPGRGRRKRSEEHTSELQSRPHLVCRLLLEKKKKHLTQPHSGRASGRGDADYEIGVY